MNSSQLLYRVSELKYAIRMKQLEYKDALVSNEELKKSEHKKALVLLNEELDKTIEQMEDPLTIIGKLEVGDAVDPQTSFFSLLRLRAESIDVFKGS